MPIPNLRNLCVPITTVPGEVCVRFPGAAEICVTMPDIIPPTGDKLIRQLFGQLNAALAPLAPIFNIIDAVVAVMDVVKAVATLDPQKIADAIPGLAEKVNMLLQLLPQLSLVALVASIIEIVIIWLRGIERQALRSRAHLVRVLNAETVAFRPGNIALARVLPCALEDLDKLFVWMNESAKPVNRLLGVVNEFLEIIGLGKFKIPCLGNLLADLEALDLIQKLIGLLLKLLEIIRAAIPIFPNIALDAVVGGVARNC